MPELLNPQQTMTPLTPEDFPAVLDLQMATYGTSAHAEAPIARSMVEQTVSDAIRWGFRQSNQLTGIVELYDIEPDAARLAYTVHPGWRGRGIATLAATAAVTEGFANLGLSKVTANTRYDNFASQKVLAKVGFRPFEFQSGDWPDFLLTKTQHEG